VKKTTRISDTLRLLFDIETDGLLDSVTKVHCLHIKNLDSGEVHRFNSQTPDGIRRGLEMLDKATLLVGHNIIDYDLPVLLKIYNWQPRIGVTIEDTLVISRLIWTNISDLDWARKDFPTSLIGRHSLKAWGHRLGVRKGTFGETTNWEFWTQEMDDYCAQDLEVNHALINKIASLNYSASAIALEIEFATIISRMSRHGFRFDSQAAGKLHAVLVEKRDDLVAKLRAIFPSTYLEMKTPAYWIGEKIVSVYGFPTETEEVRYPTKGAASKAGARNIRRGPNKVKEIPFNPASRDEIANRLKERGWAPTAFTETGKAEVNDDILEAIGTPEAKMLAEYMMIDKRLGQLASGKQSLMFHDKHGRIHGQVNTNGAVTGRCTHFNPNVAQIPRVGNPYGKEFRSLFRADEGHVLVGSDASGLELRMLGHFLARFDGGEYADIVVNGDVHSKNRELFGYPADKPGEKIERNYAKTTIYAMIYGGGDEKIGSIRPMTREEIEQYLEDESGCKAAAKRLIKDDRDPDDRTIAMMLKGADIKRRFMKNLPAYESLMDSVRLVCYRHDPSLRGAWKAKLAQEAADRLEAKGFPVPKAVGYLRGVDGRRLHVRSDHSALNTLLQHAGAIAVKKATCIFVQRMCDMGYIFGKDFMIVAHVHDEWQTSCRPDIAQLVGETAVASIKEAGEFFKFRVPLTGEFCIGSNWAETH
jgi:DNA polymerase I-like protein with 3'-5' exonuclease and polymerase domains